MIARMNIPNLRSPRDKVAGIVYFGRMIDKIRLNARGALPADYQPNLGGGFDGVCVKFLNVQYADITRLASQGETDESILAWCFEHGRKPTPEEIETWNLFMSNRGRNDEVSERLQQRKNEAGIGDRADVATFFDFIDADEDR